MDNATLGNNHVFLNGGGELGELTRTFAWQTTSLGEPDSWPQSLRTSVSTLLSSRFPMFLWWGPDLIQFYNDAYRPSLGTTGKHPAALGQPGADCWPEIWPTIKPLIDQVMTTGEPVWREDQLVPIYRDGAISDVYWTFGYSPVRHDDGQVAGVLVVTQETTSKVLLAQQNKELLFAVESAGLGIWTFDPATNTAHWDKRCRELIGIDRDDVDYMDVLQRIHPDDWPAFGEALTKAIYSKTTSKYDVTYRIVDGQGQTLRWIRSRGKASARPNGRVYRFAGTVVDVTQDVLAQRQLEENEQRLNSLFAQASVAICILRGPQFLVELANERMYTLWGRTPAQLLGRPLFVVISEAANNGYQALIAGVMQTGEPLTFSGMPASLIRNGRLETAYVSASFQPLRDKKGHIDRILIISTEVTDLVVARQQVEESNRWFTQLADLVPQIIWTARPDGYLDYYNQRWHDFVGPSRGLGDDGWTYVLHPDDLKPTFDHWYECVASGDLYEMEFRFADRRHPGQYRWFLSRAIPIRDADGSIAKWFGSVTDIHEQKMQAELLEQRVAERTGALQVLNQQLARSNQYLEQFAYVASHDLQEPLRKIQSFSKLVVSKYAAILDDEGQDMVQRMDNAAERMNSLIKDLLDYSRLVTQVAPFRPVPLQQLVEGVLDDLETVISETKALVVIDVLPTLPGDAAQLRQLFQNLLTNALKFRKPNQPPLVQIMARNVPDNERPVMLTGMEMRPLFAITITDNGIGFDEDQAQRIFGLFQRLHGRSQYAGTGIGLAVVQKVVDNHGGTITVQGHPGEGAAFTAYLWGEAPVKSSPDTPLSSEWER